MTNNKLIKIGGKYYKINIVPMENHVMKEEGVNPEDVSGFVDYNNSKIFIDKNMSEDSIRENIIHEILHTLLDRRHLELISRNSTLKEIVENIVEYLTPRFHAFLIDNPEFQQEILTNLFRDNN